VLGPNDAGKIAVVPEGGVGRGGNGGGSVGKVMSRGGFGAEDLSLAAGTFCFSDFGGGNTISGSFVGMKGGKADGVGSLGFAGADTCFVPLSTRVGNGNGSGWALALLPSRSLQARTRPNRQIIPPRAIHAYWVLRVRILAPLGSSSKRN
jgi:hypothetical protein